jgi:hypothetical protein
MRTLPSAAATQAALQSGAFPVHILEIQWPSGTVYYCDGLAYPPVACQARVIDWGTVQVEATLERSGGNTQFTVKLADPDRAIKTLCETAPGIGGAPAFVHLWFSGTSWSDRVTVFGGAVARRGESRGSEWDEQNAVWSLQLDGYEKSLTQNLGRLFDRRAFPELICSQCEGELIPIVFGDPVRRVPMCVIDRPGVGQLGRTLYPWDTEFYLAQPANEGGFTLNTMIDVVIGTPGMYGVYTGGVFDPGDLYKFTLTWNGAIQAQGTTVGVYGSSGMLSLLIAQADVPNYPISRAGYPLFVYLNGQWNTYVISEWLLTGSSIGVLFVHSAGDIPAGTPWKMGTWPSGFIPTFPPGTPVYEVGNWTYAANFLPSKEITAIELPGQQFSAGNLVQAKTWYSLNAAYYSVNLDNKTWNANLGRDPNDDPGITTVSVSVSPAEMGAQDEHLYATIRGIMDNDDPGTGTPLNNPADVISKILQHRFLGGLDSARVNATSFAAAATAITEKFAFAIREQRPLNDVCADLALQAGCFYFWDQGQACLTQINVSGSPVASFDERNVLLGSLKIEDPGSTDKSTEFSGSWAPTCASSETKITLESPGQIALLGRVRKDFKLWAYQESSYVSSVLSRLALAFLSQQRMVSFSTFLPGLKLQPGDFVFLSRTDGDGSGILNYVPARVARLSHKFLRLQGQQIEQIDVQAAVKLWDVSVATSAFDSQDCNATAGDFLPTSTTSSSTSTTSTTSSTTTTLPPCFCASGTCFDVTINGTTHTLSYVSRTSGTCLYAKASDPGNLYIEINNSTGAGNLHIRAIYSGCGDQVYTGTANCSGGATFTGPACGVLTGSYTVTGHPC